MTNEVINLDTVFSGFDSGTDLQPKNTRTNNQGVKINDIAGFVKILATAPATADLIKGDMFFALDTGILTVCTVTGSTLLSIQLV
jgi:hypothetical protein|tara:strand:- start:2423 stop:2677 length:255 start_codon:yes stop_codon:yes gene_type:complete